MQNNEIVHDSSIGDVTQDSFNAESNSASENFNYENAGIVKHNDFSRKNDAVSIPFSEETCSNSKSNVEIIENQRKSELIGEINSLIANLYRNFMEIGKRLTELKEITGKRFIKECNKLFGIKGEVANNFIRTYERFSGPGYEELYSKIPYSGWAMLSKRSVGDEVVKKVMDKIKSAKEKLKYNDIKNLINDYKEYQSPTEEAEEGENSDSPSQECDFIIKGIEEIEEKCKKLIHKSLKDNDNLNEPCRYLLHSLEKAVAEIKTKYSEVESLKNSESVPQNSENSILPDNSPIM